MRVKCPFISEKPREVHLGKKKFQSFVVQKQPLGEVVFYHRQFDQTPIDRENGVCREMHSVIQPSVEAWVAGTTFRSPHSFTRKWERPS